VGTRGNGLLGEEHAAALAEFRALDPALKRAVMAHVEALSVTDDVETVSAILRMRMVDVCFRG